MKFKKMILSIAMMGVCVAAQADPQGLYINNNTSSYSSVIITSNHNACSGVKADGVTSPHQQNAFVSPGDINYLCGATVPCHAQILVEGNLNDAKNCKGSVIGTADIDKGDDNVTNATPSAPGYNIVVANTSNSSTVTLTGP